MANKRPLTHKQVEQYLAAYRDLSLEERKAVEAHLVSCLDCARLAEEFRQVDVLLKNTARKQPAAQLSAEFYQAIERDGRSWFSVMRRLGSQLAGIAVMVLVVLSAWLIFRNGPNQTPIETSTPTTVSTAVSAPALEPAEPLTFKYTLTEPVESFALSPEGSYLATANDNGIKIWDAEQGKLLHVIKEEPFTIEAMAIETMAFTPNGVNLLARDTTGTFHRWLAFNGAYQRTFSGAQSEVGTPFVVGNTTLAFVTADNKVELWPLLGSEPKAALKSDGLPILSLAITPDGQTIAAHLENGNISIWNQYGELAAGFSTNQRTVKGLALSEDGQFISAYADNNFQLWQDFLFRYERPPEIFPALGAITNARFIQDENCLMVTYQQGFIQIWDVDAGERIKTFQSDSAVHDDLAFTRNGFLYATLDTQGRLTIWEKPEEVK